MIALTYTTKMGDTQPQNLSVRSYSEGRSFRQDSLQIKVRFLKKNLELAEEIQGFLKDKGQPDSLEYCVNTALEFYYHSLKEKELI